MEPKNKPTYDEVQEIANRLGVNVYIGSDGFLRLDLKEAISSERHGHKDTTRGSSGGCTQHEDNIPPDGNN